MEQMESAAEAKAARGAKATIRREITRVHTPATATGNIGADAVSHGQQDALHNCLSISQVNCML